eukprot:403355634
MKAEIQQLPPFIEEEEDFIKFQSQNNWQPQLIKKDSDWIQENKYYHNKEHYETYKYNSISDSHLVHANIGLNLNQKQLEFEETYNSHSENFFDNIHHVDRESILIPGTSSLIENQNSFYQSETEYLNLDQGQSNSDYHQINQYDQEQQLNFYNSGNNLNDVVYIDQQRESTQNSSVNYSNNNQLNQSLSRVPSCSHTMTPLTNSESIKDSTLDKLQIQDQLQQVIRREKSASKDQIQKKKQESKKQKKQPKQSHIYTLNDLESEIEARALQEENILKQEQELQLLKLKGMDKKDLQINRNRITAQLSRDKKKVEIDYIKDKIINLENKIRLVQHLINKDSFCEDCSQLLVQQISLKPQKTRISEEDQTKINTKKSSINSQKIPKIGKRVRNDQANDTQIDEIQIPKKYQRVGPQLSNFKKALLGSIATMAVICAASLSLVPQQKSHQIQLIEPMTPHYFSSGNLYLQQNKAKSNKSTALIFAYDQPFYELDFSQLSSPNVVVFKNEYYSDKKRHDVGEDDNISQQEEILQNEYQTKVNTGIMQSARIQLIQQAFDELIKIRKIENLDYKWPKIVESTEDFYIKAMKREQARQPSYYYLRKSDKDIIYAIDDDDNQTNDFDNITDEKEYKKFLDSQKTFQKKVYLDPQDMFQDIDNNLITMMCSIMSLIHPKVNKLSIDEFLSNLQVLSVCITCFLDLKIKNRSSS